MRSGGPQRGNEEIYVRGMLDIARPSFGIGRPDATKHSTPKGSSLPTLAKSAHQQARSWPLQSPTHGLRRSTVRECRHSFLGKPIHAWSPSAPPMAAESPAPPSLSPTCAGHLSRHAITHPDDANAEAECPRPHPPLSPPPPHGDVARTPTVTTTTTGSVSRA